MKKLDPARSAASGHSLGLLTGTVPDAQFLVARLLAPLHSSCGDAPSRSRRSLMKTRLLFTSASAGLVVASFSVLSCSTSSPDGDVMGSGGNSAGTGGLTGTGASNPGVGGAGATSGGQAGVGGGVVGAGGAAGGAGAGGSTTDGGGGAASGGNTNAGGAAGTGGAGGDGTGGSSPVVERPSLVVTGPNAPWQVSEPTVGAGAATVTVTDNALRKWKGFGGTFNEAGWNALKELSEEDRSYAIRLLFSASEGANFKWGRIPMGASDYALSRYTLCDECTPGNVETNFSVARDEMDLIPYIRAAQAVKDDILFWGSPWTPPAWMKTPQQIDGEPNKAKMNGTAENLDALAIYFSRWVEEYELRGIPIHHVQPQNEPGYVSPYPSCLWDSGLLRTFVGDHLGPTFAERGISAEIWFGTLSNNDTYSGQIDGVFGGSSDQYVKGVGLQWNTYPNINSLRQQRPDLLIMQTEHRCGNYRFSVTNNPIQNPPMNPSSPPPNDYAYAVESWGWLTQWIGGGVNAYSAWNMVLDTNGANLNADAWEQNALLVVNRNAKQLTITPTYYVFRHLSFFVDPEADVLSTNGGSALAFKNPDGSTVAVVYAATAGNVTVSMAGQTLSAQVPQQGFATFYVEP